MGILLRIEGSVVDFLARKSGEHTYGNPNAGRKGFHVEIRAGAYFFTYEATYRAVKAHDEEETSV